MATLAGSSRSNLLLLVILSTIVPSSLCALECPRMFADWRDSPPYHSDFTTTTSDGSPVTSLDIPAIHSASCYCGRVKYRVRGEPLTSKLCHCRSCQQLHGAPFEWVAIFSKDDVCFDPTSLQYLYFYNSETDHGWESSHAESRSLPVKVSCSHCRAPIADEGRNMWLAYATQFGFTTEMGIPESFRHSCHLFYTQRCIDIDDDQTKWERHRNHSLKYQRDGFGS